MFHKLFIAFALAVVATLGSFQSTSSQELFHGYSLDSNEPVGTLWVTTQATTLWPNHYDVANGRVFHIAEGMSVKAIGGFRASASGVYLNVHFYGQNGWVDHTHIRPASGGAAQTPTPPVLTGTAQTPTPPVPTGTAQTPPTNVSSGITYNVVNVRNWASLRELTSSQSRRLANAPRGAAVVTSGQQVQSGGLTWLSVSYNGVHGWMPTKYLGQGGFTAPGNNTGTQSPTVNVASGITYNVINVRNWASLRQTSSTQARRLARVPRGAAVVTTGQRVQSGGLTWLSVSYNGVRGWMPTKYLGQGGVAAPSNPVNNGSGANGAYPVGQYRIINVNNWASLRVSPSRSARRVTTIPRGHVVDHYGERSRSGGELWLRVDSGGFSGWMPVQYLGLN